MTVAAFLAYGLVLVVIGIAGYRRTDDYADFVLGGRRLGALVAAVSAGASDMSGWLLLALPGLAATATGEAVWVAVGLLGGTYLNWRLVAPRLRAATIAANDAVTLPEFLERRFAARGRLLRRLSAAAIVVFFTLYAAAGLVAGAKLFVNVFEIDYRTGLVAGAAVILAYTLSGGFFAVAVTDLVQGFLMLTALIAVPVLASIESGVGLGPTLAELPASARDPTGLVVVSSLAWGLGYFGQPHILARFMAVREAGAIDRARRIATLWTALGLAAALTIGVLGTAAEFSALVGPDPERVFLDLVSLALPAALAGFCLAGVLAAVMSTADSQLLVAASAIATDLTGGSSDAGALTRGRLGVAAVLAVAVVIGLDPQSRVLDLVSFAWAGFGATFGPVVLLALNRPNFGARGAVGAIATGIVTVIGWRWLPPPFSGVYELLPAFAAALVAGMVIRDPAQGIGPADDNLV